MPLQDSSGAQGGSDSEAEVESDEEWGGLRRKSNPSDRKKTNGGGIRTGTAGGGRGRDLDEDDDFDL